MGFEQLGPLILTMLVMVSVFGLISVLSDTGSLNGIKSRQVGDGQHGTARWATDKEIRREYLRVPFTPELWRGGKNLPKRQGLVVGSV